MKISKRLEKIITLVEEDTNVIDVGCDHALIDIYLTLNKKNTCIATDINKNALDIAKQNIKKYELENKIETYLTDGLKNIKIPDNNTIIISGMGTNTILKIVKGYEKQIDNLIIESNNDHYLLRKEIVKLGFYIDKELIVKDRKKYYVIIKFKKGYKKYKKFEYLFGTNLDNLEYIEYLINKNKTIINKLPKKNIIQKLKIKSEINYLKKFIKRK